MPMKRVAPMKKKSGEKIHHQMERGPTTEAKKRKEKQEEKKRLQKHLKEVVTNRLCWTPARNRTL